MKPVTALLAVFIAALGCDSGAGSPFSIPDAGLADAPVAFSLRVEPPLQKTTQTLGAPATVAFKAIRTENGKDSDVTTQVAWSVGVGGLGGDRLATVSQGVVSFSGKLGGETDVTASLGDVSGKGKAQITIADTLYTGGTDASTKTAFDVAPLEASNPPALEYPEATALLPQNLPPIEFQWSRADGTRFRAHFTGKFLDLWVYGTSQEWAPDKSTWAVLRDSTPDAPEAGTSWAVDSLSAANVKRASAARTFNTATDPIDEGAIYVWQSSTGTFRVIDVSQGKEFALPTDNPQLAPGQPCSGCHRISRDGKRFAFTYNGGEFNFGTLAYDEASKLYKTKIAPSPAFRGTYAAFDPLESTRGPAMLVTVPDKVPENTAGTVRLEMRNPDTNAVIPSNLAAIQAQLGEPNPGRATSMPDWSPDGSFLVFAAYSSNTSFVRLLGDDIVNASLVEVPVSSVSGGVYTFGSPKVLIAANSAASTDTGDNYLLPAISPDGSAVAYTHARGWWSIKVPPGIFNISGNLGIVRRADGQRLPLANGAPGTDMNSTWPQWAPSNGKRYAWLAYASERPYGHRLTAQNHDCGGLAFGQRSCKQLWITAVDLAKLKSGVEDPSLPAFWIPGQNLKAQYVSPQWTKAVVKAPN